MVPTRRRMDVGKSRIRRSWNCSLGGKFSIESRGTIDALPGPFQGSSPPIFHRDGFPGEGTRNGADQGPARFRGRTATLMWRWGRPFVRPVPGSGKSTTRRLGPPQDPGHRRTRRQRIGVPAAVLCLESGVGNEEMLRNGQAAQRPGRRDLPFVPFCGDGLRDHRIQFWGWIPSLADTRCPDHPPIRRPRTLYTFASPARSGNRGA